MANVNGHDEVVRLLMEHMARVPAVDARWVPKELTTNLMDSAPHTDIMDVHSSTTHDRNDQSARTIGVNEGTAAPQHRVVEVPDANVRENDVLSGRGGRGNNHPGNRHFRQIVAEHATEYRAGNDAVRNRVSLDIVKRIHDHGGRFLKMERGAKCWSVMKIDEVRVKVRQALRDSPVVNAIENA